MNDEMIMACEEDGTPIRIATREEIHKKGFWHETFHCWIVEIQDGTPYIHLQLRSPAKKDFPNLLDISAAGHILAHETVEDGVREVREELGIDVAFDELTPLGIIKDQLVLQNFVDNERCHVFLYKTEEKLDNSHHFQKEEVAGVFKFDFQDFYNMCIGVLETIRSAEKGVSPVRSITLTDLVPHGHSYLEQVVRGIQKELEKDVS